MSLRKPVLELGIRVRTKRATMAYYAEANIPKGAIGEVGAIHVPYVDRPGNFNCVDFVIDGRRVKGAYKLSDLEIIQV